MSRSLWKTLYVDKKNLNVEKKITIYARSNTITKDFIGFTVKIYNGIRFYEILVIDKMIGHKFGEFAPTIKFPIHKKKNK